MKADTIINWKELRSTMNQILIHHESFDYALNMVRQCFAGADAGSGPVGLSITCAARSGKSEVAIQFRAEYPESRDEGGRRIPVLYYKVPSKPTVKGLAEGLLQALGDPKSDRGTEIAKTRRLKLLLREVGTLLLILDEFQHFVDKTSERIQMEAADWLKVLIDDTGINLVVIGLPYGLQVIRQNEQLRGRFLSNVEIKRFDWKDNDERKEFIRVITKLHQELSAFDIPVLHTDEMAFRIYCASGGLMGYIVKILRQAIWNAADRKTTRITLEDLEIAYLQTVGVGRFDGQNPFAVGFMATNHDALVSEAKQFGMWTEPVREATSKSKKNSSKLDGRV